MAAGCQVLCGWLRVERVEHNIDVFHGGQCLARGAAGHAVVARLGQARIDDTLMFCVRAHQWGRGFLLLGGGESTRRFVVVPVMSEAGQLLCELRVFLSIALPFVPPAAPLDTSEHRCLPWFSKSFLIGHRGSGSTWRRFGVGENTMLAFETAFRQGLTWAEFDVQLTKDRVPVLFHDVLLPVANVKVPLSQIDLKQLKSLSFRPPGLGRPLGRSRSMEELPLSRRNLGKAPEYAVHDSFPTLSHVLEQAPEGMGFNVEVKHSEWQSEEALFIDRNTYVDIILAEVFRSAGNRPIVFSSFDPDICMMLRAKQTRYGVLFLTEGGTVTTEDERKNSLEEALNWAVLHKLDGCCADVTSFLPARPEFVSKMIEAGLIMFSYGSLNNQVEYVKQQKQLGVAGIITDTWRVLL